MPEKHRLASDVGGLGLRVEGFFVYDNDALTMLVEKTDNFKGWRVGAATGFRLGFTVREGFGAEARGVEYWIQKCSKDMITSNRTSTTAQLRV